MLLEGVPVKMRRGGVIRCMVKVRHDREEGFSVENIFWPRRKAREKLREIPDFMIDDFQQVETAAYKVYDKMFDDGTYYEA